MLNHVQTTTLDNGCRIVTSSIPRVQSLGIGFFSKTGSRFESSRTAGHSHFLEHMLFKGSAKRSARAISQAVESRGGNMNAYTNFEQTVFYAVVPSNAARIATDVLGDMYLSPKLAAADVDCERTVILQEVSMYRDQPDAYAADLAQQALWTQHPLGCSIIGTPEALHATTAESLDVFHHAHYNARSTVIAAAGEISHARFLNLVAPFASRLPDSGVSTFKRVDRRTPQTQLLVDRRETEQVHAVLGYRTFGRYDSRRYALNLLSVILGGNMSSRLFQTVREKHGLAYSVSSFCSFYADAGSLQIVAGLDRMRSTKALALIVSELQKLVRKPVSKAEFARAREYLLGCLKLSLETARSHMAWIGNGTLNDQFVTPGEAAEKIKRVTREEVQALARQIFIPDYASLALVMPRTEVDEPEMHLDAALS